MLLGGHSRVQMCIIPFCIDLILCIMILYKNYIRILGSYIVIFIRECGCNYKVNVCAIVGIIDGCI